MPMSPRLLRPILSGDPDALRYIAAVQAADQQSLEPAVRKAINDFVVGCKADGIWTPIKAACLLAGPRTLAGINVPLVGKTPTFNAFTASDYDRETGLVGNGSSKYINANRNSNEDPQDNVHAAVWVSTAQASSAGGLYLGVGGFNVSGSINIGAVSTTLVSFYRSRNGALDEIAGTAGNTGLVGLSRSESASYAYRTGSTSGTITRASQSPVNANYFVFSRNMSGSPQPLTDGRLAFYSIGESLDLALLDARVSAYITAIGAAI